MVWIQFVYNSDYFGNKVHVLHKNTCIAQKVHVLHKNNLIVFPFGWLFITKRTKLHKLHNLYNCFVFITFHWSHYSTCTRKYTVNSHYARLFMYLVPKS